ncbi:MAG: hypothetical protein KBE04_13005 [Phycisphaerae bacterium]|nr:hypothetical protein [Phycisphaerae bacterium]
MNAHDRYTCPVCALLSLLAAGPTALAYPPDPNNAALLYYQAFISLPVDQGQMRRTVSGLPFGVDPNAQIRDYLEQCLTAINLAGAASQIQACDWGIRYSQGSLAPMPHLVQMRTLAWVLRGDAVVLAADHQHRQAIERCLTLRRMANHVDDETVISFIVSTSLNSLADKAILEVLGVMPPDEKTLVWLESQWEVAPTGDLQIENAIRGEEKFCLGEKGMDKDLLMEQVKLSENLSPDQVEQLRKADDAFLEASLRYRTTHFQSALAILAGTDPYLKKLAQLEALEKKPESDAEQDPHAILAIVMGKPYTRLLILDMRARSNHTLLKTAIEVYLAKARTGSVPDQLPPGVPKDPFNGQDFKYEKAPEGFTLTRWTDDPAKDKNYRFTFKVR